MIIVFTIYGVFFIKRQSFADIKHIIDIVFVGLEQAVSMNVTTGLNIEYSLRYEREDLKSSIRAGVMREIASILVRGCNDTPNTKINPIERKNTASSTELEEDLSL